MSCWEIFCPRRFPSLGFLLGSGSVSGHMPSIDVSPTLESMKTLCTFLSYSIGIVCRSSLFSASSSLSISISASSCSFICIMISPPSSEFFPALSWLGSQVAWLFLELDLGLVSPFLCLSADSLICEDSWHLLPRNKRCFYWISFDLHSDWVFVGSFLWPRTCMKPCFCFSSTTAHVGALSW